MHHGWGHLYGLSVKLGVHDLVHHGPSREGVIRIGIPLDPSRYLELPWAERALEAQPGDRVLDLASPKLLAVSLARAGVEMVSVDAFPVEVERWQRLAPEVRFEVADGRSLPFEDASFDRAYSVSVVEHIADDGDEQALRELARVVEAGGRILLTVPYADTYWEDWRDRPLYSSDGEPGKSKYFFERWYDGARLDRLVASAPVREVSRELVRTEPNWSQRYNRNFPWLLPLGPVYGLLGREVSGPGGDIARLVLERAA